MYKVVMVNFCNNLILKIKKNKEGVNVLYLWLLNWLFCCSRVMREREILGGMNYGIVINEGVWKGEKKCSVLLNCEKVKVCKIYL